MGRQNASVASWGALRAASVHFRYATRTRSRRLLARFLVRQDKSHPATGPATRKGEDGGPRHASSTGGVAAPPVQARIYHTNLNPRVL